MRLNRQSEIAIEFLVACAGLSRGTMRTGEIAERADVSKDSAAQIVLLLSRAGFLKTTRGRFGGVALTLPAREILLGEVLRRVQPDLIENCARQDGDAGRALNIIVGAAEATFLAFLDRFSIADLVDCRKHMPPGGADQRLNDIIWGQRKSDRVRHDEYAEQAN